MHGQSLSHRNTAPLAQSCCHLTSNKREAISNRAPPLQNHESRVSRNMVRHCEARPMEHGTAEISPRHESLSVDHEKQCDSDDNRKELGRSTWIGTLLQHDDMHVVEASTEEPTRSHLRATCDHASRKTQQRGVNLAVPIRQRPSRLGVLSASSLVCGYLLPMLLVCGIMS